MKRIFAALLCALTLLSLNSCFTLDRYESSKSAYDGIIEEYTALLTAKQNGEELPEPDTKGMDEREAAIAEAIYKVAELCKSPDIMGYAYKDTDGDRHGVTVSYPQMPYLGLWHRPKSDAPYVCIEPWCSLPSGTEVTVFEQKQDLLSLAPGHLYRNHWSIRIHE